MDYIEDLKSFLDSSVVNFYAIENAEKRLVEAGYKRISEDNPIHVLEGDKIYFKRNDLSIVALNIGENSHSYGYPFHIIASHVDSPCFKIKPHFGSSGTYGKIDVEPYGGMIASSWMDRLLSIAGRVNYKSKDKKIVSRLINFDADLLMMPNLCIHFNRDINSGYNYNFAVDTQPFIGEVDPGVLMDNIAKSFEIDVKDIITHDLFVYNRDKSRVWGMEQEYISSPRLDDLECVYTSLMAFINNDNPSAINVLYLANNEEVGSASSTGADGDFLYSILNRIARNFDINLENALNQSFLISADNAHALHPNHPEFYDSKEAPMMNKGIVIKYNASNRYTSDSVSSAIFIDLLNQNNIPYQFFSNRSDIRGGSTLGNILLSHTSMMSVDIGLAQLAMHSSFETAGVKDVQYAIDAFSAFYKAKIYISDDYYKVN